MRQLATNWTDYTLRDKPTVTTLQLSVDNYSDRLFIHPPLFVYGSALLHYFNHIVAAVTGVQTQWRLSLPAISMFYQLLVLLLLVAFVDVVFDVVDNLNQLGALRCCGRVFNAAVNIPSPLQPQLHSNTASIPPSTAPLHLPPTPTTSKTVSQLHFSTPILLAATPQQRFRVTTLAVMLFCSCPIAFLCSQKFWLDNGLLLTVTLSVVVHLRCTTREFHTGATSSDSTQLGNRRATDVATTTKAETDYMNNLLSGALRCLTIRVC